MPKVVDNPTAPEHIETGEWMEKRQDDFNQYGIDEHEMLEKAKDNISAWKSYFSKNIKIGRDDANFLYRSQWGLENKQAQNNMLKLSLSFNKLRPTVRKIVGEQRQNQPELIVRSLNGRATEEELALRGDMIRSISYQSQSQLVYQCAFNSSLSRGFGAFEVGIDYEHEKSFKQVIRYDLVQDVTQVAFDPAATEPHKGDGSYCARLYMMSQRQFKAKYGWVGNPSSFIDDETNQIVSAMGAEDRPVIIARYTDKVWVPKKLLLLSDGKTMWEEEWEGMQEDLERRGHLAKESLILRGIIESEIPTIKGERMSQQAVVTQYDMLDDTILEHNYWPSKYLPLVFVDGDSQFIEGQQHTSSYIHDAIDTQKFYNYVYSEIATEVRNRRKEQWMATPDNVKGHVTMWRQPEAQQGALIATPDPKTGQMPIKLPAWEISQSMMALCNQATQDMRELMGFAEAEISGSRDISGKAKRQRRLDAAQSTYVYHDNLNQAIAQGGRIVLDLLPMVYGQDERGFVLFKSDGSNKRVILNKEQPDGKVINALERGDYDIEIDTGPSFAVQKEEAIELLLTLVAADPQKVLPLTADLIAKNLDVEFRPQIEARLKHLVPPEILAEEAGEPPPQQPPSPADQMMQMQMQLQQLEAKEKEQEIQMKSEQHQLESMTAKEKINVERARVLLEMQELIARNSELKAKYGAENFRTTINYQAEIAKLMQNNQKNNSRDGQ